MTKLPKNFRKALQAFSSLGGKARAKKLTPERRREIARQGAQALWKKKAGTT